MPSTRPARPTSPALPSVPRAQTTGFLARVASDGAAGYYTVFPAGLSQTVAVDANGNVALFGGGVVQRIDSSGAATLQATVPGAAVAFALDAAGNAYVAAVTNQLYPVKNSLATCLFDPGTTLTSYSELLNVIAPGGSILQATYIPGGDNLGSPLLAVTPTGTVLVAATAGPGFTPTQTGPFPAGTTGSMFLSSLSPTAVTPPPPTNSLTCAGSSASLSVGPISPGALVTLFGNGLGPQQGVQPAVASPNSYPTRLANVQVTLDGTPAPLLWVQDTQINLVVPWSLTPGQNTQVCVSYNNANTNCLTLPVVQATPAVFMVDARYAAALNQDGTYKSAGNPAAPGSIVTVFATGLGPIAPSQSDGSLIGLPLPANTLTFGVEAIFTVGSFLRDSKSTCPSKCSTPDRPLLWLPESASSTSASPRLPLTERSTCTWAPRSAPASPSTSRANSRCLRELPAARRSLILMLELRNVSKRFAGNAAVDDVSFTARAGEVTGYLGPNGSGKSTTMKMITALIEMSGSGQILFDGEPIHRRPDRL